MGRIIQHVATVLLISMVAARTAFAVAETASAAPAPEKNPDVFDGVTKPASWLTWGFDSRNRWEYHQSAINLQGDRAESEFSYMRLRERLWTELRPITNLTLYARLMTEPRFYYRPDSRDGWANEEALFDSLFLQTDDTLGLPASFRVGRQELHFGDKWLIFDGTPGDGSRSEFFDAARLTIDLKDALTTVEVLGIFIGPDTDEVFPVINDRNDPLAEQYERAGVLYVSHEFSPAARLDVHYIYRHLTKELKSGDNGDLHIPGARFYGDIDKKWDYVAESAVELGEKNDRDLRAWGFNGYLGRNLGGAWKHHVQIGYEYMSGDDPDTKTDEGWDPVWGRRARWSELLVFTFGAEARGRRGYFSNLQRPNIGWTAHPTKKLELVANYMFLFANDNPQAALPAFSDDGKVRGQLLQTIARYQFTKHWSGLLWNEVFFPGDFYARSNRDTADFVRAEISLTF